MIWGEEEAVQAAPALPRSESPILQDWVVVGPSSPAPGDLASLEPLRPGSSTPPSLPSSASSEVGDEAPTAPSEAAMVTRERPHPATSRLDTLAAEEVKSSKSAQLVKQRNSGKSLSSKALNRSNKCVLAESGKRGVPRHNFNIKMAGNKNLKQC